jgi:Transglutaminase-like superfamily
MTVVRGDGGKGDGGTGMTVARVTGPAGWLARYGGPGARALVGSGLALVAGAAFAPAFGPRPQAALTDTRFVAVLCGAAGIVTAVCLLLWARTRVTPATRSATAVAALAGYVLLVVAPGWRILSGPKLLLTGALPVEPAGPELATVVVAVGVAALTGVEPALRGRSALVQILGPVAVTGLGWGVCASAGVPPGWLAPIFVSGCAGALALARYGSPHTHLREASPPQAPQNQSSMAWWLRAVAAACALALVAGLGVVGWLGAGVLSRMGRANPVDARDLVDEPVLPKVDTSPLSQFQALRSGKRPVSVVVTADQPITRMRYVAVDRFDGAYWTTQARYRRAGRWLPLDPETPAPLYREEHVRVLDGTGLGWLVSSGRPVEISQSGLAVDDVSGDLVVPADRSVPESYTVRSAAGVDPASLDPTVGPASQPAAAPAEPGAVASIPADLVTWARQVTGGERGLLALRLLEQHFAAYQLDASATPVGGHGTYQIRQLRLRRTGTAEQYASAYAVLARGLGYDSRVVVGFRPEKQGENRYVVTGRDVYAWPEVRFAAVGWVPFDPTPTREDSSGGPEEPDPTRPPDVKHTIQAGPTATATPGAASVAKTADPPSQAPLLVAVAMVAMVLLCVASVPTTKAARRRVRRSTGDPRTRAVNAWRDAVDGLMDAGLHVRTYDTARDVVASTRGRFDEAVVAPAYHLAVLHDEVVFAPPATLRRGAAHEAWQLADAVRAGLRTSLRRRIAAALSLRSLIRRHASGREMRRRPSDG